MNDRQTEPGGRKKGNILVRLLAFLVTLALIFGAVTLVVYRDRLNFDVIRRYFTYRSLERNDSGQAESFAHEGGVRDIFVSAGENLLVCSTTGVRLFSGSGTQYVDEQIVMEQPVAMAAGDWSLAYDAGGSSLYLFRDREKVFSLGAEEGTTILSARVNETGWLAVVAQAASYKGSVTVYNPQQQPVLQLNRSSGFLIDAAVTEDGKYLAAVTVSQSGASFVSSVDLYRLDRTEEETEPDASSTLDGSVPLDLRQQGDTLWVLGDTAVFAISLEERSLGERTGTYSYPDQYLKEFSLEGEGPTLTGSFSEDAIAQACGQVETLQLQERLHIRKTKRIQEELIRVPNFAALYGVLCRQEIGDEEIASVLESADGYGEKLTAYPQEQVLAVMKLELLPSLRFEYLKYYFPFVMYEEEEQVILDNLQTFPIAEWKGLSMLTEHQRDMMRQPFLGSYLFFWHQNERKALELLEQNRPLQRVCILLYRYGVRLFLSVERLKDLRWMKMTDVGKFRRLLAVFEYDAEDLSAFFDLWLDNHAGQYDLNWFISQPHPLSKERREEILCNQLSYLNALYAGRLHLDFNAVRQFQFSILIYAVEHRKKHFLELVDQNSEVFLSLGRYSLLFEPGFCEHCNINSLTLKNLKASDSVNRSDSFFTLLEEGQQYTFEEMYQLWHQKEVYVRLYTMLTPLSIDQRLLTLRQLIKRDLVSQYTGDAELEQLGKCLLERPFSEWYRGSFGHICGLTRRIAMGLLQHYTQLQAFIPDFTTESDAVFALNNMMALLEMTDWKQVRKDILTTDADWLDLKEKLAFSDDFVEQNRETVTEFLLQGGAAMVCALYGELDGQELAVEALRRIVQAELMGQFYKLKYFAGDLQREIRYPVSEMQESFWKKNLSLARGAFWAEEVDDFYHTLRLGELPHSTCLSYRTGSQRECLLAAFDSNKKIVLVKKDEAVVARACLRLTKGAFQKPPAVDFSFADLSQENMDSGKPVTSEKPVLFLESIYTFGLNDIEKEEVMKLAVSLTTQKAAELGVVAVLARRYLGCYERDEYVLAPFYVYISKSKNGWQYLDSLGGAAYTSAKEEYVEHPFLVIQTAMHHAGAHNRNEVDYE